MTDSLLPPDYHEQLLKQMIDGLATYDRLMDRASGIDPDNRPTIYVEEPLTPEWLQARVDYIERWQALTAEGTEAGYLDRDACYECGGELIPTTNTTRWVSQPNPAYDPDKPKPPAQPMPQLVYGTRTITIPKADE